MKENDVFSSTVNSSTPHNIIGTSGRNLMASWPTSIQGYDDSHEIFWMDKSLYSAFSGTNLDIRLQRRKVDHLYVGLGDSLQDVYRYHFYKPSDAYNLGIR